MDLSGEDSELFYRPKRQKLSESDNESAEETKPFTAVSGCDPTSGQKSYTHALFHSQRKLPCCSICGDELSGLNNLRKHLKNDHKLGPGAVENHGTAYIMAIRSKKSKKKGKKNKNKNHSTGGMMKCKFPKCKQKFPNAQTMRRHYGYDHAFSKSFYCMSSSCNLQFTTLDEVDLHFRNVHPQNDEVEDHPPSFDSDTQPTLKREYNLRK